jgi:tRNA/rRNA methyltransferase
MLRIILVESINDGNVGSVARVMKNFGFDDLVLVNPCELGREAFAMASHASDILTSCRIVDSVREAVHDTNITIGTTSKPGLTTKEHVRMPFFSPKEVKSKMGGKNGIISILFGREDKGLSNSVLKKCDMIVYISTSQEYPVMNLSHAVTVILYELSEVKPGSINLASNDEKERFFAHFGRFLKEIDYREYKREKTQLMLRRIFGRAELTDREVHTLRGILRGAERKIGV